MKIFKPITLLFFLFSLSFSYAAVSPDATSSKPGFTRVKAKDFEKILGKKLTLLQKIELKIFQKKLGKFNEGEMTPQQRKQAKASLFLGIGSLVLLLFSSALSLLCIPAAILAIIFGAKSLKGNSNAKGIVGIVTGGVTLLIVILAVLLVALLFAAWV